MKNFVLSLLLFQSVGPAQAGNQGGALGE